MSKYDLKDDLLESAQMAELELDAEQLDWFARGSSLYFKELLKKYNIDLEYGD